MSCPKKCECHFSNPSPTQRMHQEVLEYLPLKKSGRGLSASSTSRQKVFWNKTERNFAGSSQEKFLCSRRGPQREGGADGFVKGKGSFRAGKRKVTDDGVVERREKGWGGDGCNELMGEGGDMEQKKVSRLLARHQIWMIRGRSKVTCSS